MGISTHKCSVDTGERLKNGHYPKMRNGSNLTFGFLFDNPLSPQTGVETTKITEFSARVAGGDLEQITQILRYNVVDISCIHFSCLNLSNTCLIKGEKTSVSVDLNYFYHNVP